MRRAVRGIGQPAALGHRIPGEEHVPQLLLRQRLRREDFPDFGVVGRGPLVTGRYVHGVEGGEAVDDGALDVGGEDVGHGELRGRLRGPEVGHVEQAVDERGHRLVVAPGVGRRDRRTEAREGDVRLSLVKWRRYHHDVVQRVSRARFPGVADLIETGRGAWK